MRISAIAAIGKNRELGKNNNLLWRIPEDTKHFREITSDHVVIMGRKTYESMMRLLPNRTNIIITRDKQYKVEGAIVVDSVEKAIEEARSVILNDSEGSRSKNNQSDEILRSTQNDKDGEIFIIGGGQIYKEALPYTDRLYLTIVDATDPQADTFFPDYSEFTKVVEKEDHESGEYRYTFLTLEKNI